MRTASNLDVKIRSPPGRRANTNGSELLRIGRAAFVKNNGEDTGDPRHDLNDQVERDGARSERKPEQTQARPGRRLCELRPGNTAGHDQVSERVIRLRRSMSLIVSSSTSSRTMNELTIADAAESSCA